MSIESELERLNFNLETLIENLTGSPAVTKDEPAPPKKPRKPAAKPAAKKGRAPRKSKLNYDKDVKPQVLIAIATPEGREDVKKLLATFEVSKATEIDPDDYTAFLKGIEEIIEKHDDDDDDE